MPRGRKSPLGIEGTSVSFRDPRADGRLSSAQVRAKDEQGTWQAKRFAITSWRRDGSPVLPDEAVAWARAARRTFVREQATAGMASMPVFLDLVADNLAAAGVSAGRVVQVRAVSAALAAAGIRDMRSESFPTRVRTWLSGLQTGWCERPDATNRRLHPQPLSAATRNKLLIICRQATKLAVMRRKIAYDPLVEIPRFKGPTFTKPIFTVAELRHMVSDAARDHATTDRAAMEQAIQARQAADGCGRTAAIKALAAERDMHWASIYHVLQREPQPDPWWLACCLLAYTGARADEAMHLRWEWIQFEQRIITLRLADDYESKSDTERLIPLEPELADILRPMSRTAGHILPPEIRAGGSGMRMHAAHRSGPAPLRQAGARDYTQALRLYLARIGLDPGERTAHSLRHNYITLKLARIDTNVERLRKAVGHAEFSTTQGYGTLSQLFEREVDRWPDSSLWLRRTITDLSVPTSERVK